MEVTQKRIALLATGDEIINGDTINTNAPYMAQHFFNYGIQTGMHMTASDEEAEITDAIRYLLERHHCLITIGGLGPTSDDRTRFALAKAINLPLYFDEASWQRVVDRLESKNLAVVDTNRQQANFPEGAFIIPNANGTADACLIMLGDKRIYMLPGPPNECRPIFDEVVLPQLLEAGYARDFFKKSWLLFGVSESNIASQIEELMQDHDCILGYRVHYPYLEVKLFSQRKAEIVTLAETFETTLADKIVSYTREILSAQLTRHLEHHDMSFCFEDRATNGLLQAMISTPKTVNKVAFTDCDDFDVIVKISGLDDYWQDNLDAKYTMLSIHIRAEDVLTTIERKVSMRKEQTREHAVEIIAQEILKLFFDPDMS